VLPALSIVLALASLALDRQGSVGLLWDLRSAVGGQETHLEDLEKERRALLTEIHALRTEPTAVEALAREKLGMVRPGEVVIRWHEESPPARR
jgi:cell division protein FtsB